MVSCRDTKGIQGDNTGDNGKLTRNYYLIIGYNIAVT